MIKNIERAKKQFEGKIREVKWEEGLCLEWGGACSNGYGSFRWQGRTYRAHTFAYILYVGRIPKGKVVHHRCLNKACVKVEHLELTSRSLHSSFHVKNPSLRRSHYEQKSHGPVLEGLNKWLENKKSNILA